jgi:hypothetical protein
MKYAIVLTTINVPELLHGYAANLNKFGHADDVEIIVVGDRKTPPKVKDLALSIEKKGVKVDYLDVDAQSGWLKKFPELDKIIPYNSDNRRNVGYLVAVERGAEIVISIDDDNFVRDDVDFIKGHQIVGTTRKLKAARSSNGWFNICSMLQTDPKRGIYPRGFPYSKRWKDSGEFFPSSGRVVMNAGLWLKDPDVDAVTRLNEPVAVVSAKNEIIMLDKGTFSPINTQNTSFHRDVLPCYYYITMNVTIRGLKLDRYGDIWSGFFAKKVIDQMDDRVTVGGPVVDHIRNTHNLFRDLQNELWGMILTDSIAPVLESISLTEKNYSAAYLEFASKLDDAVRSSNSFREEEKKYISDVVSAMRAWIKVCKEIM